MIKPFRVVINTGLFNTGDLESEPDRADSLRIITDHVLTTCSWKPSRVKDTGLSEDIMNLNKGEKLGKIELKKNMRGFLRAAKLQIEAFHGLPGHWVKPFYKAFFRWNSIFNQSPI